MSLMNGQLVNNMITTAQVVALGFSRALLSKYVKEGLLERGRHGVYILPDSVHDDMYTLMLRSEKIIFSHDTALFLNGLSERTPFEHSVTIPSNSVLSDILMEECTCYYIKPELLTLGMVWKKTEVMKEVFGFDKIERGLPYIVGQASIFKIESSLQA